MCAARARIGARAFQETVAIQENRRRESFRSALFTHHGPSLYFKTAIGVTSDDCCTPPQRTTQTQIADTRAPRARARYGVGTSVYRSQTEDFRTLRASLVYTVPHPTSLVLPHYTLRYSSLLMFSLVLQFRDCRECQDYWDCLDWPIRSLGGHCAPQSLLPPQKR